MIFTQIDREIDGTDTLLHEQHKPYIHSYVI